MPGEILTERRARETRHATATVNGTDEAGADTVDTEVCPDDKIREVWAISCSNPNNAPVYVSLYIGDTTTKLRTLLTSRALAAYGNFVYTNFINNPIAVVRPNTTSTTVSNRIYGIVDANSMIVDVDYVDK